MSGWANDDVFLMGIDMIHMAILGQLGGTY